MFNQLLFFMDIQIISNNHFYGHTNHFIAPFSSIFINNHFNWRFFYPTFLGKSNYHLCKLIDSIFSDKYYIFLNFIFYIFCISKFFINWFLHDHMKAIYRCVIFSRFISRFNTIVIEVWCTISIEDCGPNVFRLRRTANNDFTFSLILHFQL